MMSDPANVRDSRNIGQQQRRISRYPDRADALRLVLGYGIPSLQLRRERPISVEVDPAKRLLAPNLEIGPAREERAAGRGEKKSW